MATEITATTIQEAVSYVNNQQGAGEYIWNYEGTSCLEVIVSPEDNSSLQSINTLVVKDGKTLTIKVVNPIVSTNNCIVNFKYTYSDQDNFTFTVKNIIFDANKNSSACVNVFEWQGRTSTPNVSSLVFSNCKFTGANGTAVWGGENGTSRLFLDGRVFSDCEFYNNTRIGHVKAHTQRADKANILQYVRCAFYNNGSEDKSSSLFTTHGSGGYSPGGRSYQYFSNCIFANNTSLYIFDTYSNDGGGVGSVSCDFCIFYNNNNTAIFGNAHHFVTVYNYLSNSFVHNKTNLYTTYKVQNGGSVSYNYHNNVVSSNITNIPGTNNISKSFTITPISDDKPYPYIIEGLTEQECSAGVDNNGVKNVKYYWAWDQHENNWSTVFAPYINKLGSSSNFSRTAETVNSSGITIKNYSDAYKGNSALTQKISVSSFKYSSGDSQTNQDVVNSLDSWNILTIWDYENLKVNLELTDNNISTFLRTENEWLEKDSSNNYKNFTFGILNKLNQIETIPFCGIVSQQDTLLETNISIPVDVTFEYDSTDTTKVKKVKLEFILKRDRYIDFLGSATLHASSFLIQYKTPYETSETLPAYFYYKQSPIIEGQKNLSCFISNQKNNKFYILEGKYPWSIKFPQTTSYSKTYWYLVKPSGISNGNITNPSTNVYEWETNQTGYPNSNDINFLPLQTDNVNFKEWAIFCRDNTQNLSESPIPSDKIKIATNSNGSYDKFYIRPLPKLITTLNSNTSFFSIQQKAEATAYPTAEYNVKNFFFSESSNKSWDYLISNCQLFYATASNYQKNLWTEYTGTKNLTKVDLDTTNWNNNTNKPTYLTEPSVNDYGIESDITFTFTPPLLETIGASKIGEQVYFKLVFTNPEIISRSISTIPVSYSIRENLGIVQVPKVKNDSTTISAGKPFTLTCSASLLATIMNSNEDTSISSTGTIEFDWQQLKNNNWETIYIDRFSAVESDGIESNCSISNAPIIEGTIQYRCIISTISDLTILEKYNAGIVEVTIKTPSITKPVLAWKNNPIVNLANAEVYLTNNLVLDKEYDLTFIWHYKSENYNSTTNISVGNIFVAGSPLTGLNAGINQYQVSINSDSEGNSHTLEGGSNKTYLRIFNNYVGDGKVFVWCECKVYYHGTDNLITTVYSDKLSGSSIPTNPVLPLLNVQLNNKIISVPNSVIKLQDNKFPTSNNSLDFEFELGEFSLDKAEYGSDENGVAISPPNFCLNDYCSFEYTIKNHKRETLWGFTNTKSIMNGVNQNSYTFLPDYDKKFYPNIIDIGKTDSINITLSDDPDFDPDNSDFTDTGLLLTFTDDGNVVHPLENNKHISRNAKVSLKLGEKIEQFWKNYATEYVEVKDDTGKIISTSSGQAIFYIDMKISYLTSKKMNTYQEITKSFELRIFNETSILLSLDDTTLKSVSTKVLNDKKQLIGITIPENSGFKFVTTPVPTVNNAGDVIEWKADGLSIDIDNTYYGKLNSFAEIDVSLGIFDTVSFEDNINYNLAHLTPDFRNTGFTAEEQKYYFKPINFNRQDFVYSINGNNHHILPFFIKSGNSYIGFANGDDITPLKCFNAATREYISNSAGTYLEKIETSDNPFIIGAWKVKDDYSNEIYLLNKDGNIGKGYIQIEYSNNDKILYSIPNTNDELNIAIENKNAPLTLSGTISKEIHNNLEIQTFYTKSTI